MWLVIFITYLEEESQPWWTCTRRLCVSNYESQSTKTYEYHLLFAGLTERAVDGLGDGPPFTTADAQHLNYSIRVGYQVLLPGMKFNRYGNLTSWSALVVFHNDPNSGALHQTLFQIWRPTGSGRYKLVGFDEITVPADVIEPISTDSHENENLAYYVLNHREEDRTDDQEAHADKEENKPLYFKPGDIVGFLIQSFVQTANGQMYVTYHNQTASDPDHEVMDMFYITTDGSKGPCEINTCSEEIQLVKSVVPNIFFTYGMLQVILIVSISTASTLSR